MSDSEFCSRAWSRQFARPLSIKCELTLDFSLKAKPNGHHLASEYFADKLIDSQRFLTFFLHFLSFDDVFGVWIPLDRVSKSKILKSIAQSTQAKTKLCLAPKPTPPTHIYKICNLKNR
jgi:hypothetical protein